MFTMSKGRKKSIKKRKASKQSPLIILFIPIIILAIYAELTTKKYEEVKPPAINTEPVPAKYIPIYKAAAKEYDVPWYLLAAHHRVETRFSKMDTMTSPVGAEGPMQFMPCTFVGWKHPSCEGLGKGEIPKKELEDPHIIKKYGGYGVDGNGDGRADPWNLEDAVFSAAKFLSKNGAAKGKLSQAVYSYNHSEQYVKDVLYYANLYKKEY
jgi:peptidoglycan LD-endopeptidase LytH